MTHLTPSIHPIRGVLFDLDGTLVDSAPDLGAAANVLRTTRGLAELPLQDYRPFAGAGARGMLGVAFDMTPDHPDFSNLREAFFSTYERIMLQNTHPFEGVTTMLDGLRARGIAWGVVTNKSRRFTEPLLKHLPWAHDCAATISGDTTPHPKPHPAPMLAALNDLQLPAKQCIYIGDDLRDIQAGHAAGIASWAALWGYMGATPVSNWGADGHLATPLDVLQCIDKHNAQVVQNA